MLLTTMGASFCEIEMKTKFVMNTHSSDKKIRTAFLVHHPAAWGSLHEVYLRMENPESGFLPKIFTLPCDMSNTRNFGDEEKTFASLQAMGLNAYRPGDQTMAEYLLTIKKFAPEYLFRQAPWDNHLPPEFCWKNLGFSKICYVPYGFMTANIEQLQFNQPFHHACWGIFCETRLHKLLYVKNSASHSRNLEITGFPKFETLWKRRDEKIWPTPAANDSIKIIWAPHHTITKEWLGFSTFLENHLQFYKLAKDNPHLHIVLRPHPALFGKLLTHGVPESNLQKFLDDFTALPNTALYETGDVVPLFGGSDVLITDGIGFFSEYMMTGKPIIYTDSGRSVGFNPAGEMLVGGLYRTSNFTEVLQTLSMLVAGQDPLRSARERIRNVLFDPEREFPSTRILRTLQLHAEAARSKHVTE